MRGTSEVSSTQLGVRGLEDSITGTFVLPLSVSGISTLQALVQGVSDLEINFVGEFAIVAVGSLALSPDGGELALAPGSDVVLSLLS